MLVDLVYCLTSVLLFDIPLLYTIILIPRLSITFCLFFRDIYLSLGISLSSWFVTVSELFCIIFLKFLWLFDISVLCYFNPSSSKISCVFFWRYISYIRYFFIMIICNCFWVILLFFETFAILLTFLLLITIFFYWFLNRSFWSSFKRICCIFRL